MTEKNVIDLIKSDPWMMEVLRAVRSLNLPDSWVGGGFIRSKVWDHLHGFKTRTPLPDIDVIYLDSSDFLEDETNSESTKMEKRYEAELGKLMQDISWSVTNQARMHVYHNCPQYKNCKEALKDWVETATCIAVRLDEKDQLHCIAPWGVEDLVNLKLRPANFAPERVKEFHRRIESKNWLTTWPKLRIATF